MYRYQILIEYVGTPFVGWQIQKKGKSVQKIIQSTLSKLLKEKIILYSAGRTDREVHANGQSAHFDVENKIQKLEGKIDWNENADKIIGKINGLYPYPGAFFSFNGERYKILKADKSSTTGKPGDIVSENFEVCCGEGSIKVLSIQREGKRVQQINEFLLGTQIKKGTNIA